MRVSAIVVLSIALALLSPAHTSAASARGHGHAVKRAAHSGKPQSSRAARRSGSRPHPVTMRVSTGYGSDQYRSSAWAPVRVSITNHTREDMTGTVEIPESNQNNNNGPPQPYRGLYEMPVTLPSGSTKHVVLYIPGYDAGTEVDVRFRGPHHVTASAPSYPSAIDDADLTLGVLSGTPSDTAWLQRINLPLLVDVFRLSPSTLDPVSAALATFDAIVLTDVDSSRLDREQLDALTRYVRGGGTLMVVGGPNWQETLRPLPAAFLPGRLSGERTLSGLDGLVAIDSHAPKKAKTTVSLLSEPRGTVLARESGVPLVVRQGVGSGSITYLAFDPSVAPVAGWQHAGKFLGRLMALATPDAMARAAASPGGGMYPQRYPFLMYGPGGGIANELANIPSAALPSLVLFVVLTLLYILLLGPGNYLILRRLRRLEWSWVTVPVLGVLCVGGTFGVAYHLKGSTVLVNTVSFVPFDGSGTAPASLYVGLFAPVRGDYRLTLNSPSLPATIPNFDGYISGGPRSSSIGVRFREGSGTDVSFVSMNMWSSRGVALQTSLKLPGAVTSDLHIDRKGAIVGSVHNGTRLTLLRPAIMAGQAVTHLPDMPAGASMRVHVKPVSDAYSMDPSIGKLYGTPRWTQNYMGGPAPGIFGFWSQGPCCYGGPQLPEEKSLRDRIRNAVVALPEAQTIPTLGEVVLTAWTDAPLTPLVVDGETPHRRDLTLLATPLSVHLPSGQFRIRSGTLGAHLVDTVPSGTNYNGQCCGPFQNAIRVGWGGSVTFRFDIPRAQRVHFRHLSMWINAGGADGEHIGSVYDWHAQRWSHVDLSLGSVNLRRPDRFISSDGALLVKLSPTMTSGDVRVLNPFRNLQLVGSGTAA